MLAAIVLLIVALGITSINLARVLNENEVLRRKLEAYETVVERWSNETY